MTASRIARVTLFGPSGAGKTTTGRAISTHCAAVGIGYHRLGLAEPLYRAQAQLYRLARRPLEDPHTQDGELLAILGRQLRRINPTVLTDDFADRLHSLTATLSSDHRARHLIVCDDMRFLDWAALEQLGFLPVQVYANERDCDTRRRARGDISVVDRTSWTEQGLEKIPTAHTISNTGSIEDLTAAARRLVEGLLG